MKKTWVSDRIQRTQCKKYTTSLKTYIYKLFIHLGVKAIQSDKPCKSIYIKIMRSIG